MTRTAANNFFLQKSVPYVIHPDKFKKKRKEIFNIYISKIVPFFQSSVFPQIPFLTPLDEVYTVKLSGHQLFQENALLYLFSRNGTNQTCNITFCIMVGSSDWLKNICFLAFKTYNSLNQLLMLYNSLGCMNEGDFCVIPDKAEDTENSFNALFILHLSICGTSQENCEKQEWRESHGLNFQSQVILWGHIFSSI